MKSIKQIKNFMKTSVTGEFTYGYHEALKDILELIDEGCGQELYGIRGRCMGWCSQVKGLCSRCLKLKDRIEG